MKLYVYFVYCYDMCCFHRLNLFSWHWLLLEVAIVERLVWFTNSQILKAVKMKLYFIQIVFIQNRYVSSYHMTQRTNMRETKGNRQEKKISIGTNRTCVRVCACICELNYARSIFLFVKKIKSSSTFIIMYKYKC